MTTMRYAKYAVAVFLTILISIAPSIAYSQLGRLTVEVDKLSYGPGEAIVISGTVPTVLEEVPVVIQVFNPNNVMYAIDQIMPDEDGTYSTSVKVGGKLGITGTYTVKVTYMKQSAVGEFDFTAAPTGPMRVHGIEIEATLSNGSVSGFEVDEEFNSLIISVRTTKKEGTLEITLPREVIDSKLNGNDDDFIVLVDGEESAYEEMRTTSTSRILTIPVHPGASEIEILGTQVIPEYGIIAVLILAIAVGTIIAISRKNQILNVLPR